MIKSGDYAIEAIRGSSAAYATDLGLKSSTSFLTRQTSGSPNWSTVRTEDYGYDADFDYLTSVDYNDGLANEVQTWDYDAAGNRSSASANPGTWTYDNLNRMSASPGTTYTHDMIGNRLTKIGSSGSYTYSWDAVNRMTGLLSAPAGQYSTISFYEYRADGMRVRKQVGGEVTRSYYDAQMPIEEDVTMGGSTIITRNFVGARGIEVMFTTQDSVTTSKYPLYDTHGSMIASLTLSSGGTGWTVANARSYDVWGGVRMGAATGGPKGRYVANLGHVQDDESGLMYMRARYYEPESGRFVSEDPAMDGSNWFTYCANDPVNFGDYSGKERIWLQIGDFEVSFDWYTPNGSSDVMGDIHWRPIGNKAKDGLGSIRSDGTGKHGMDMPNELKNLLAGGKGPAGKKHHKMCRSLGIAVDSIRASFNADPFGTMEIILLALFGLDMVWNKDAWGT